jgi:DEAD/DEAH box helicase domain-containing protein
MAKRAMSAIPRRKGVAELIGELKASPELAKCITAHINIAARPAQSKGMPTWLDPRLVSALKAQGINELYRHQRLAVDAARRREDVVVVTPTASGKTLCYNLPVIQSVLDEPSTRAFYLFPTKALSQDQVGSLRSLSDQLCTPLRTWTYDGDTPADARTSIRNRGHVVVTNPDMLHAGILPNHPRWRRVLQDLRYVVVDEMHSYRGVFGSHVANVLRRLRRLCEYYGSSPIFICSSATISNPEEHARRLIGRKVTLVGAEENGAPSGPKDFVFYNPPVLNKELGIRKGVLSQARRLASPFIENKLQTICFTGSRLHTEVLSRYLRERHCKQSGNQMRVASYRGGYLPNLRRKIEKGLRDGQISCVVSTNALELGIDIGRLDVAILAGYPGSVASAFQQAGRAGRSLRHSLVVLVARNTPLDQYVINNPDFLFGSPAEHARIDPDNLVVLVAHIKCALYELPFHDKEEFGGEELSEVLDFLAEAGVANRRGETFHWADDSFPADGVSLRSSDPENVVIIDQSNGSRVIAETDRISAQTTVHEGAIYLLEGKPYQVDRLDWPQKKAFVRALKVDHYTTAMSYSRVRILDAFAKEKRDGHERAHGDVHVATRTIGYKKIKLYTGENCGFGDVHLPDVEMHTTSLWLALDGNVLQAAGYRGLDVVDGLIGLGKVMQSLAALHLMCDPGDLGMALADPEDSWVAGVDRGGKRSVQSLDPKRRSSPMNTADIILQRPTLFIHDAMPAGVGFAEKLYELSNVLLLEASARIAGCHCDNGCPSCVGPLGDVDEGARAAALDISRWLSGEQQDLLGPVGAHEFLATQLLARLA